MKDSDGQIQVGIKVVSLLLPLLLLLRPCCYGRRAAFMLVLLQNLLPVALEGT